MYILIRKQQNGTVYFDKTTLADGKIPEERLYSPPYNYKKIFVDDDCAENLSGEDFTENLEFSRELYNLRVNSNDNKEKIARLKQELAKWKEDVEQVELFGMERADYEQKKARCAEIILELRELEKIL